MANRRFEYRQVLTRMRLGDSDRAIAPAGLMDRRKAAQLRLSAEAVGWLDVATPLPGDGELAVHLGSARTQPAVASLAEPHRERITRWWRQGIQGTTIHGALVRSLGFTGSYSSVRRFLAGLEAAHPQVTMVLEFDNFSPEGGGLETANRMRDYELANLELDGWRFPFSGADRGLNRSRTWDGTDLSWSAGDEVRVRILDRRRAQEQREAEPSTAELRGLPPAHDGQTPFTFRIAFSEDVAIGFEAMRDHAVTGARRGGAPARREPHRSVVSGEPAPAPFMRQ